MIDVSIIIVNYNTKELTNLCINSIVENTEGVSYEIIVVDNASTDGSVDTFIRDNRIIFVQSAVNLGFGKANNLGYEKSVGKYIFFLNSDTLLKNNAVKLFYEKMESTTVEVGCLGCILQDMAGGTVHSYANFPSKEQIIISRTCNSLFTLLGLKKWELDPSIGRTPNEHFFLVDYVTGADLFVRRSIIENYGLFDPDFFMYYEETEMQFRYINNGFHSYIYDAPQIVHLEGGSFKKENVDKYLIKLRSSLLYLKKTRCNVSYYILKVLLLIKFLYTAISKRFSLDNCVCYLMIVINPKNYC